MDGLFAECSLGRGRELDKIVAHVTEGDKAYLNMLGGHFEPSGKKGEAIVDGLGARARGELPDKGPRGGARWPARYFARRCTWHVLDHVWEIDDRAN